MSYTLESQKRTISSTTEGALWQKPLIAHVEITEFCNERCRHCYNFDRATRGNNRVISWEDLEDTIEKLEDVKHIIVTGGEPLVSLDKTLYLIGQSLANGSTVSLNSNLVAATPHVVMELADVGVEHILTTLHSHKADVHDYIADTPGAHSKVAQGIRNAVGAGIRVSANLILSELNRLDVYETGKFAQGLGVTKFLANRMIPDSASHEDMMSMFDSLLKLKAEGMEIGTCRMVPECMFDDLEKYQDFVNRGCAAGKRHFQLNVDGTAHACVHDSKSYGNIHEIGVQGIWDNMADWRTTQFIPKGCIGCPRLDTCEGGCKMLQDNLCRGKEYIDSRFEGVSGNSSPWRVKRDLQEEHS